MRRVLIVGLGALGSELICKIRNIEDVEFDLCDGDRVETKNTLSQAHPSMAKGQNKARSMQQTLQMLWGMRVNAIPHFLREENGPTIIGTAEDTALVIDCVDNGDARRLIRKLCRERGIPLIHGGLAANGKFGVVEWDETFDISDAPPGAATCEDGEHLPFISMTVAHLAYAVQQFLKDGTKIGAQVSPRGLFPLTG